MLIAHQYSQIAQFLVYVVFVDSVFKHIQFRYRCDIF